MQRTHVAIVGAGPYGLTAAAHLRAAGVETRVFGAVMHFWKEMPAGMLLRSAWDGSHLSDPARRLALGDYERACGVGLPAHLPMSEYARYGEWFQRQAVPEVDPRLVTRVDRHGDGYRVTLEDGEAIRARRAVVTTGLTGFARREEVLSSLPAEVVTHTSEERDLSRHAGKRVAVIGAGQSALECAALLNEGGATVEVLARGTRIFWLGQAGHVGRESGKLAHLLYPPGAVGPLGVNWVVQLPALYRALPGSLQARVFARALRPAGSGWVKPRLAGVTLTTGATIAAAAVAGGAVRLTLADSSHRIVDHVLLGTGYRIDVDAYPFLAPELARAVARIGRQPRLRAGFESSMPGLHFLGAASDLSYGPLMRFVAGTEYAASSLARSIRREARSRPAAAVPCGAFSS